MAKTVVIYYSLSGSTRIVAEMIAKAANAELSEIALEEPYTLAGAYTRGGYDLLKKRLPIIQTIFDIEDADIIYLGGPVWFYTVPPPLRSLAVVPSFIDYIDSKKIIPFCTDGGNKGRFFETLEELYPEADFAEGREFKHVKRDDPLALKKEIEDWVKGKH